MPDYTSILSLGGTGNLTLAVVFLGGLIAGLSPCTLPTVCMIVGYVGGYSQKSSLRAFILSLSFVMSLSITLALLGAAAAYMGGFFSDYKAFWYLAAFLAIIMGLQLMGIFELPLGVNFKLKAAKGSGIIGAFLLGIPFAFIASPCTAPVTATVLGFAATKGNVAYGTALLFAYSLGRSIPLLAAGTFTGIIKKLSYLEKWNNYIMGFSGGVLVVLGLYLLFTM